MKNSKEWPSLPKNSEERPEHLGYSSKANVRNVSKYLRTIQVKTETSIPHMLALSQILLKKETQK